MSFDLIVFDPAGLHSFPSEADKIVDWINAYVAENEQSTPTSPTIQAFLDKLEAKWGAMSAERAPWMTWPPVTLANGRYCTLNLDHQSDTMNLTISLSNAAMADGLVMLDPQGRNPLMTTPGGGGMMDV